ncbi:MAG: hypothetical protein ONB46_00160 [candidate division KSB1 bacterium]|nr:hypothetical protein [candidate division KSB1 bacterium]MDZ7364744.1 hypothetical protein [candidate division KSB1 bacterium]MDZ7402508.1 hypothetical protein [candidate division KSB1 bacterium]
MKTEHAIREAVALVIVSISHPALARLTELVNRELGGTSEDRKAELQEPPGSAAASLIGLSERWSRALRSWPPH